MGTGVKLGHSLTLREEHRVRVFEYRVLREIFGPKRVEITRDWKILYNDRLYGLYSGDETKKNETGGACSTRRGERRTGGVCWENHKDDFKEIRTVGKIILKWILKNGMGRG